MTALSALGNFGHACTTDDKSGSVGEGGSQGGLSVSWGVNLPKYALHLLPLKSEILYRSGMNAKIKRNFQVFTACDFVASTIAIIPTLIAAGKVAHDVMTAIKSGSS